VNDELMKRVQLYAGQTDLALSILTAGDMHEIPMTGSEAAAIAAARAYWSPARGLLVVADRLPAPPTGRIYQVWVIPDQQKPVSAGLLGEQSGGRGMLIVHAATVWRRGKRHDRRQRRATGRLARAIGIYPLGGKDLECLVCPGCMHLRHLLRSRRHRHFRHLVQMPRRCAVQ
jgi:hypothetical protein